MLHERRFETKTRGLVQGPAILCSDIPTGALRLLKPKGFARGELNVGETHADVRSNKPCAVSWKIVIRSRETKELIWSRPFASHGEALIVWLRLLKSMTAVLNSS